ncbi:exonuclease domain-containing protein [Cellulosilyticum lentocellum]|uniref:Exonuclease RNase T and DNA polymerase III n=1 Tax=Cellulosilyticum lentocellum (strain ATCC 49066 / DSM 5427 / NCIMB 11756 / RHM5) TaxID=642492 RepID=F2JNV2_CELLD|nr:exonuclease domain-containing protein [Cellulosilyticum lentocellum]ADZ82450.1 Exonuclease RNase T and DNA polymerase III [Cellulosilyticum lentocellum DSM 5427]
MNYVVIDFETANSSRSSACSLGMVKVHEGNIVDSFYSLINPEDDFDLFNTSLTGITQDMVCNSPTFNELWPDILSFISDHMIVAHYASFDLSVLRNVLLKYNIPIPTLSYCCTRNLSKKTFPNLINYRLDTVASYLDIEFNHHHAFEDAHATAVLLNHIFIQNTTSSFEDLHSKLGLTIGKITSSSYTPSGYIKCVKKSSNLSSKDIVPTTSSFDDSHPLYDMTVIFTGTLSSMLRRDAMQKVVDVGGHCKDTVGKSANYLVIGIQDYSRFVDGEKSSKLKKAELLISEGYDLEIIDESTFLQML